MVIVVVKGGGETGLCTDLLPGPLASAWEVTVTSECCEGEGSLVSTSSPDEGFGALDLPVVVEAAFFTADEVEAVEFGMTKSRKPGGACITERGSSENSSRVGLVL